MKKESIKSQFLELIGKHANSPSDSLESLRRCLGSHQAKEMERTIFAEELLIRRSASKMEFACPGLVQVEDSHDEMFLEALL